MGNKRSLPGKGDIIAIYVLGPDELCDGDSIMGYGKTAICGSTGEDFSDSAWPVVVKVKAKVTKEQLIQHLSDLTKTVQDGFFVEVKEEKAIGNFVSPGFVKQIEDTEMQEEEAIRNEPGTFRLVKIFGGENAQKKAALYAMAQGLNAIPITDLPPQVIAGLGLDETLRNAQGIQYSWAVVRS